MARRLTRRRFPATRFAVLTVSLLSLLVLGGCRGGPRPAATPTEPAPSERELSWTEVEERLQPATVLVHFQGPAGSSSVATGVAYAPGLVVTIVPPLEQGIPNTIEVVPSGSDQPLAARVRSASPCDGIAIVALDDPSGLRAAPLGHPGSVDIGVDVLVYGHSASDPDGTPVSAPAAIAGTVGDPKRAIQQIGVNVDLSGFAPGSLLADRHGAVLGLLLPTGLFLPAERLRELAVPLGEERGWLWLGIGVNEHRNPDRFGTEHGLVVLQVTPNGPAASAGVRPGMLLTALDGQTVDTFPQICEILRQHRQGDELALELRAVDLDSIATLETRIRLGEASDSPPTEVRREPRTRNSTPAISMTWTFEAPHELADWPTGTSALGTGEIRDGSYAITLTQPNSFGVFPPLVLAAGTDQRIAATVSLPEQAGAGLVVRSSQDADGARNLYLCAVVRVDGRLVATCSLALGGQSFVLLPPTPLTELDPATDPLTLELEARDTRLTFRVAGRTVLDEEDPMLGHGQVALWVESFGTVPVTVRFHEVQVELTPR
ncbi:MAG: S1C family serine protease [Thermomicrobium sp.]|nr:S1C family serine protease [Thermomicrobium sp.]